MNRKKESNKIEGRMKDFLKENPKIKKALRVFEISHDQYRKTIEGRFHFYNDTSSSPRSRTNQKTKNR